MDMHQQDKNAHKESNEGTRVNGEAMKPLPLVLNRIPPPRQ